MQEDETEGFEFGHLYIMMTLDDQQSTTRSNEVRSAVEKWLEEHGFDSSDREHVELCSAVRLDRINRDHAMSIAVLRVKDRKPRFQGKNLIYDYTYEVRITDPVSVGDMWNDAADAGGEVRTRDFVAGLNEQLSAFIDRVRPWPRPSAKIKEGRLSWRYA